MGPPPPSVGPPPLTGSKLGGPGGGERGALLAGITGFNKGNLKKSKTVDKSAPVTVSVEFLLILD